MRAIRLRAWIGAALVAAMAAAAAGDGSGADAEDRARIGKHGASIPLEGGWRRKKLTADFGEDQFVCDKRSFLTRYQLFLLARELEARLESRADLARALKEQTDGMLAGASLKPADVVLQKGGEALRASQELDAEYQGTKLRYRLEIVSRGGLSYLLTAWTARSHGAELTAALKKLAEGLQFPGEGSEWAKLLQPITKKVVRGGLEISFLFRPAIFAPDQETTEGIASLFSRDRDSAILIYDEPVGGGPDALLDEALESRRRKSPRARQVSRGDVQVGGAAGRKVVIDEEDLTLWVVALPAEPGRLLEIRYVSAGGADLPRTDRDLFFETFRLARPDDLEAFPEASAPPPSAPVDEHLARLLEGARFLGDTQVRKVHQALLAGERLLVAGSNEVKEISLQDGTARIAYRAEGSQDSITFAPWHDVLAVADDSGELLFVEEGEADPEPEPQDAEATFVAWAGPDRLLVLRKRTPARVAGLGALPWAPPDRLVVLEGPEEEERELREVHAPVRRLCANGAASAVLVATSPVDDPQREPTSLQVVPLGPGEGKDLDRWRWISFLGPAGDGWVVTGRREGLPRGVYWVQGGGEAELLISGPECTGVAVEGGELTFLTSARLPGRGPPGDSLLAFRVSLEAARRHGPLSFPFSTSLLSRIADQVFRGAPDGWPFRSAGEIGECARRGVEVSRELAGRALPVHGRELDRVVGEAFRSRTELTSSGEVLLGVLLAAGFLERGAVWVPSPAAPARGFWQPRIVQTVDSIVAVGYSPADVIASTLHDGEGIWEPVATISRYLKGRKLLLGLDREALAEALAREPVPDLAAAARAGDAAAIGAALRAAPANELLRQRAYLQLSAEGRYDLVAEVAGELARREGAMLVDRKAWLLARTRTAAAGAELAALREDIRKAIEAHPGEASFYLFLGQACEREGGDLKRARACYHRVLKLEAKGDVADQARERLEALEAG